MIEFNVGDLAIASNTGYLPAGSFVIILSRRWCPIPNVLIYKVLNAGYDSDTSPYWEGVLSEDICLVRRGSII